MATETKEDKARKREEVRRQRLLDKEAREVISALTKYLNVGDSAQGERRAFLIKALRQDHPLMQQAFTRLGVDWLTHMAHLLPSEYDARNAASVRLGKTFIKKMTVADTALHSL